jgi:hypothetical protein
VQPGPGYQRRQPLQELQRAHHQARGGVARGGLKLEFHLPGGPHLLDQNAPARQHLHQPGDDRVQQRVQFVVAGRTGFDEHRHAIGAASVHPVQHQAVQVDVQVGGRAKTLDQRDCAAMALRGLEPDVVQQMARDHALHHLQHRRDQLGLCGRQQTQRDGQREHPLAHRHLWDDVLDQMGGGLRHPARAA